MKRTKTKLALVLSSIVTFQACQPIDPGAAVLGTGVLQTLVTGYGIKKQNQNSAEMIKQLEELNKKSTYKGPAPFSFGATKPSMVQDFAQLDRADANKDGIITINEGYVLAGFYSQPSATFWPALLTQSDISKDGQITKNEFLLTL